MKITDVKEIWISVDTRDQQQRLDLFYEDTYNYKYMKEALQDEELNAKTLVDWMDSDYKKSLEENLKENDYFYYFEIVPLNGEIVQYDFNEFLDYDEELIECIVKEDIDNKDYTIEQHPMYGNLYSFKSQQGLYNYLEDFENGKID